MRAVNMLNMSIALMRALNPKSKSNSKLAPVSEPLLLMPGHQLSRLIREGQLSSERLCELVAERIRQVQPHVNAMSQDRFVEALEEARRIDELVASVRSGSRQLEQLSGHERELLESPLLGVPVSVKESIQMRGMRNTCGLWSRREHVAQEDAVAVANLRRAGLVPICTSNVPECTLYWADCQNCVYGRTVNPYDSGRITGGSSGGEGALLGSGASVLGLGSDIGGSLRIPAHYCGVFSHKPSAFLVSPEGNFPGLKAARLRLFSMGPMCRYASDLRPLLKCLLRDTPETNPKQDSYGHHQPANIGELRRQFLKRLDEPAQLARLRVLYFDFNQASELQGVQSVRVQDDLMRGQMEVIEMLETKFQATREHVNLDKYLKKILITWQCLLRCCGKQHCDEDHDEQELEQIFGISWLALEFLKVPFGLSRHTMEALLTLAMRGVPDAREKAFALCCQFEAHAQELHTEMMAKLAPGSPDAPECVLIMPTMPSVAYKHHFSLAKTRDIRFAALINVLLLPATHATVGLDKTCGMPYGVTIMARPYADHLTLAVAEQVELAFGGWTQPGLVADASQRAALTSGAADPEDESLAGLKHSEATVTATPAS